MILQIKDIRSDRMRFINIDKIYSITEDLSKGCINLNFTKEIRRKIYIKDISKARRKIVDGARKRKTVIDISDC